MAMMYESRNCRKCVCTPYAEEEKPSGQFALFLWPLMLEAVLHLVLLLSRARPRQDPPDGDHTIIFSPTRGPDIDHHRVA
jgi:hypothetical protein